MIIIALQLHIALLVSKLKQLQAQLPPAQVQMIDWTPLEAATRIIPDAETTLN